MQCRVAAVAALRRSTPTPRTPAYITEALSRASNEELLLELRRRITRPRERRREMCDNWTSLDSRDEWDSLESRGDWPEEG